MCEWINHFLPVSRQPILVECQMCDALECARDTDGTVQILRQEPVLLSGFEVNAKADIRG